MNEQIPMGIDPKLKKDINEEGYDEDGGLLIVGTPEERDLARQKIENEGRAENLGAYIKLHKEIFLPKEEISPALSKEIENNKGFIWNSEGGSWGEYMNYKYIDRDGNVANITIDFKKIATLKNKFIACRTEDWDKNWKFLEGVMKQELENLGFVYGPDKSATFIEDIESQRSDYIKKIEAEAKEKKKDVFEF